MSLGIIGGGQLGRMLTTSALGLGFEVVFIDPGSNPPAAQVGGRHIQAELTDEEAIRELVQTCEFVTWEIEHISTAAIRSALTDDSSNAAVEPSIDTLEMIQDKLLQKRFLQAAGIAVAPFVEVTAEQELIDFVNEHQGAVIKTRRGGYDGRGNCVVTTGDEASQTLSEFGGLAEVYVEELQDLAGEISVIVARDTAGATVVYDPVDSYHSDNICHMVVAPSQAESTIIEKSEALAGEVVKELLGAGVFAIEMFVTSSGEVMVNEIAPRVHNSGHHTIEACHTSQFEQHVRAVTGLPLGDVKMKVPAAVMINILGETQQSEVNLKGIDDCLKLGASFHWYGKSPVKVGRKMGHMTLTAQPDESIEELMQRATLARKALQV